MIRVLFLIFINLFIHSELILEITESGNKQVKIAILQKMTAHLLDNKLLISFQMILKGLENLIF